MEPALYTPTFTRTKGVLSLSLSRETPFISLIRSQAMDSSGVVKLMEVATLCCVPMAVNAAIKLNVLDILADHGGPDHFLSPSQIASHFASPLAPSTSSSLDRILRVLASHGLLASSLLETPQGELIRTYGLNSASNLLVHDKVRGSMAPYVLLIQEPVMMQCFYDLHESILDGGLPFTKVHGMKCYDYTNEDARFNHVFNRAMAGHTKLFMHSLLEAYHGFEDITSLVDVGGGIGACLGMILSKHPHIKGINFDQVHVVTDAPEYPGVEHVGGDMFKAIPTGDAMFMKWILHNWSDAHCLKILENCYKALPSKGKVIAVDVIIPIEVNSELDARLGYHMDLLMFAYCEGGKERTQQELENMSKATGFAKMQIICNVHGNSIVEFYKD